MLLRQKWSCGVESESAASTFKGGAKGEVRRGLTCYWPRKSP